MLNSFGHEPLVVTSINVKLGTPQLSVAVGVVKDGVPEHSIVEAPGRAEIIGGTVSSTLIVCVATVTLPQRSVAVQVLVILNSFGHEPVSYTHLSSVAVQVRVMLYSFGQVPLVVKSAKVNKGVPQLSVAVGVVHDGVPEHSIVCLLYTSRCV